MTIDSLEYSINLRERCGFYSKSEADVARFCFVDAGRKTIEVVDEAMKIRDKRRRLRKLKSFQGFLEGKLSSKVN
jgi:hypothetical protein